MAIRLDYLAKWLDPLGMSPPQVFELADRPTSDVVKLIRHGLPAKAFGQVADTLHITKNALARKLGVAQRTVNRKSRERDTLSAETSEKLIRVARVHNRAKIIFSDDEAISDWLGKSAPALGGVAPIDLLDTDLGARDVESLILGIAYGNVI